MCHTLGLVRCVTSSKTLCGVCLERLLLCVDLKQLKNSQRGLCCLPQPATTTKSTHCCVCFSVNDRRGPHPSLPEDIPLQLKGHVEAGPLSSYHTHTHSLSCNHTTGACSSSYRRCRDTRVSGYYTKSLQPSLIRWHVPLKTRSCSQA